MSSRVVAHLSDIVGADSATPALIGVIAVCLFASLLVIEHLTVKHGSLAFRPLRTPLSIIAVVSLAAVAIPASSSAQGPEGPVGLPDLISDPSFIWFTKNVEVNGEVVRVLAFDGHLHNIGTGNLDLYGNPQIEGGVKQRVFDGENWEDVGTPTVRYETDDGHNHFHLIAASEYALWDEGQTQQVDDASKVGFCLLDSTAREETFEPFYDITDIDYCSKDDPDATELSMGITPGWADTYDANTTLQWVDISNTEPGRYWVSAVTDPNDEIVESNEDNNGIVFSSNKFAVPGYVARPLELQDATEPIQLRANVYGVVGDRAFVVADGPTNGTLDVPIGVDLLSNMVRYTPDPGFVGQDRFTYYAHDVSTMFPLDPTIVEVVVEVSERDLDTSSTPLIVGAEIEPVADQTTAIYQRVELQVEIAEIPGSGVRWFAKDLPTGLTIDAETAMVTGVPTMAGDYQSTIVAHIGDAVAETSISWSVADADRPPLSPINDFSSTSTDVLRLDVGERGTPGIVYEASGVPEGTRVVDNFALLTGEPAEIGDFEIEVRTLLDGEVVDSIQFVWTVRPSVRPAFAL